MLVRQRVAVHGIVQGVGFRPYVHRLANELGLAGWVRNDATGVILEVQGRVAALAALKARLPSEAPARARIDGCVAQDIPLDPHANGFEIRHSAEHTAIDGATIGPDSCICEACLVELFDPDNRRHRYAFINCTDCGPRYTIASALPWDRERTSMASFTQCPTCLAEYADPTHRRFHAEPNACADCGPSLSLLDANGQRIAGDPIKETLFRIRRGEIVAIKGLGGFHLACDARDANAVARLRTRKHREEKPLAVMFAGIASIVDKVEASTAELAELASAARPIVLMHKLADTDRQFVGVAPGLASLGVMLPSSPLHYLLFHEATGRPAGTGWLNTPQYLALVMTSANPRGEPLVTDNAEALNSLAGIADAFLVHDRDILIRADDSVLRLLTADGTRPPAAQFLRRARGYAPTSIKLGGDGPEVLALGAFYKNTLCFARADQGFLSQHIGDLDRIANCLALESTVDHLQHLIQARPQALAHDMHPDFFSTRLAQQLALRWQVPAIAVQHHHAHIAAVLAEHHIDEPALGLALDGVGLGSDGQSWGGELLRIDGASFERLGHLRPIALVGGDKATREPWRMGAAALALLGRPHEIVERYADQPGADIVTQMLARKPPTTSSMGRWFDAAAGLLGIQPRAGFEAQAAMRLEGLAEEYVAQHGEMSLRAARHELHQRDDIVILDFSPALSDMLGDGSASDYAAPLYAAPFYAAPFYAALFHAALIDGIADWAAMAAERTGIRIVACGGGCFLNAILTRGLRKAFAHRGLRMFEAQAAPPGDGGLALGQAWVARRTLA